MHTNKKLPEPSALSITNEIQPLIFAPSTDHPACRIIADGIASALDDDYPNAISVASLVEIEESASRGPVVVVPVLTNLDMVARSGHVSKHNVAIVGWTDRLGMAHWDQFDVESFLQESGLAISSDFRVDFGLETSHLEVCTNAAHRHLSVGVLEGETLQCLPVVEIPNATVDQQTMYLPGRPYLPAELNDETALLATEIATALHRRFCCDLSRTELTLDLSGRLSVSTFVPIPMLSSGSLIAWASKLVGLTFQDLCWELVTNAASRRFGVVDIHSEYPYPADALSNYYPNNFYFDRVNCGSAEGLLQSLKYQNVTQQAEVARLVGSAAKQAGATQNEEWMKSQLLWWRGEPMERLSERYQRFLQSIYVSLFEQSAPFRSALAATRSRVITHRVGLRDASQTVLTEREFVRNLTRLRSKLLNGSST